MRMTHKRTGAKRSACRAFTLIELTLVIIIISVLAATVMPRFFGRSEQARIAAAKLDIKTISTGIEMFELDTGRYPQDIKDLRTNPGIDTWKGPYLKKDPKDPWAREYEYSLQGSEGKDYKVCTKGPSEEKTEDDICE